METEKRLFDNVANADCCSEKQKIKTHFAKIIVGGTVEMPCYNILYVDPTDKEYHIGFSSFCLEYVFKWLSEEFEIIDELPTVDAVEVVHGEWSTNEDDYLGLIALQCSKCNQEYWFEDEPPMKIYNYCPNCGAKMDGERKDND